MTKSKEKDHNKINNKEKDLKKIKMRKFVKNNKPFFIIMGVILIIGLIGTVMSLQKNNSEANKIYGDDVIDMHYFYLSTCPHCIQQEKFHKTLKEKFPMLRIHEYEMSKGSSYEKYVEMAQNYDSLDPERFPGTPLSLIGTETNVGFGSPETTGQTLIEMIESELQRINSNWSENMTRTVNLQ